MSQATRTTVDEHIDRILAQVRTPEPIELALLDGQGLLCAEEVSASEPLPGFDTASTEGYAVRAQDVADATQGDPVVLPVVGDVAAGSSAPAGMLAGQCIHVMPGAPMPGGADAVVPIDDTDRGVARVRLFAPTRVGAFVRHIGEDVEPGDIAVSVSTPIGPAQVALLAAVGRGRVLVHPRPRVVVVSTGSELVDVGQRPAHGELVDVNSYALSAAARDAGADVYRVGVVSDDKQRLLDTLEGQLLRADVMVTSGGMSEGAHDVVTEALSELGSVHFDRVAINPGAAQAFGLLGSSRTPFFGLPGDPVSALVSFEVFVRPAIRLMLGKRRLFRRTVTAVMRSPLDSIQGERTFSRGVLRRERDGSYSVEPFTDAAHQLASFAQANALIVLDEITTSVRQGDYVTVLPMLLSGT